MPLVYASTDTSRCRLQDSRPGWIRYFLSCRALASPTTCRFIPALSGLSATPPEPRPARLGSCVVIAWLDNYLCYLGSATKRVVRVTPSPPIDPISVRGKSYRDS